MYAALFVLLFSPLLGCRGKGPFSDLSLDQALTKAQREQKIAFVDFFTTWCGPCKKLDSSTWKDQAVQNRLAEKTVALKIDAEKGTEILVMLLVPCGINHCVKGYRDGKELAGRHVAESNS